MAPNSQVSIHAPQYVQPGSKAAFSSCGNHDNLVYNHSWGELHYGVKEVEKTIKGEEGETTETVWEPSITTNPEVAENLKGKLMLIHGEIDDNVHPANTLRLADALIKAGKRFDMMIFPGKFPYTAPSLENSRYLL